MARNPSFAYLIREGFIEVKVKNVKDNNAAPWSENEERTMMSIAPSKPYRVAQLYPAMFTLLKEEDGRTIELESLPQHRVLEIAGFTPPEDKSW